jgi:diguanylate cyclase (GGDEF)-like protein
VFANRTLQKWIQWTSPEFRDIRLEDVFSDDSLAELRSQIQRVDDGNAPVTPIAVHLRAKLGRSGPMHVHLCRVTLSDQQLVGLILQSAANPLGLHDSRADRRDPLTELPDRDFLFSRLATLLEGDRVADRQFAVLFIDLNNFKQINDSNGHLVGDRVLRDVAQRLSDCVRDGDHVTRFGGDEFVVLLEHVAGPDEINPVIDRIHRALAEPIALPEGEFTLSVSIGVAQAAPHHQSADDVLREADQQMYLAKRARISAG